MMTRYILVKMKITHLILLFAAILVPTISTNAKEPSSQRINREGFYIGTHAAISAAESNFSSFGVNKFHPGWNAGVNAGYQFTSLWSLELSASWSQVSLVEQDCCFSRNYILGYDLNRYYERNVIPEGMIGQYYKNVMSRVFVQRYGLQVNFNVLGLFNRTKRGPWGLELSPVIYAASTHANIFTKTKKAPIAKNITAWHLGYGGQLFASYAVAKNMHVGLYGAYTQYIGSPIDGLPQVHSTNYTADAGVKFVVTFNRKKSTVSPEAEAMPLIADNAFVSPDNNLEFVSQETAPEEVSPQAEASTPDIQVATETTAVEQKNTDSTTSIQEERKGEIKEEITEKVAEKVAEKVVEKVQNVPVSASKEEGLSMETPFPIIYFSFNSVWIEPEQRVKIDEIAKTLKADRSVRIRVIGWGDEVGGDNINKRVSFQRAEAVKKRLERHLISGDRIEIVGGGIAPNATTPEEGRIAIVQIIP